LDKHIELLISANFNLDTDFNLYEIMPKELWTRQTKKKICNVCGYNKHVEVAHL